MTTNKGDSRKLRDITYIPADQFGTAYHQCTMPSQWINEHTDYNCILAKALDYRPEVISKADVLVLQRGVSQAGAFAIADLYNQSVATVLDLDDNFWNLPSTHQARPLWPTKRIQVMEAMIRLADGVTCHSEGLRRFLVAKFPDCVHKIYRMPALADFRYTPIKKKRDDIRIGWVGASQHQSDINPVVHAVNNIIKRNPKVKLITMGLLAYEIEALIPWWRRETYAFVPAHVYQEVISTLDIDIAIAAVSGETFHESQSARKYLDYACASSVTLANHLPPYTYELPKEAPVLWVRKHKVNDWERTLEEAIELDHDKLGRKAYKYAKEHHDGTKHIKQWTDIYEKIFEFKKWRLENEFKSKASTNEEEARELAKNAAGIL